MGGFLFIVCLVLAVMGLAFGISGLVLDKNSWVVEKFSRTFRYRAGRSPADENSLENKTLLHREIGWEMSKGLRAGYGFEYRIPEFYAKIFSGDKATLIHAFVLFGFFAFAVFTFYAIGIGLIQGGNENGWIFIGAVTFIVVLVCTLHIRQYRRLRNKR